MACFDNVVALKELCTDVTPFSGVYLNDIGITKNFIESIITKDYDNVQDFVDSKIAHALRITQNVIYTKFGNQINTRSLIESKRLGYTEENKVTKLSGDYKGIQISLSNSANFLNLFLSAISLQVNHNGVVNIEVYDLYQNKLLDTIPITAVSGEIATVYAHKKYRSDGKPLNLFIGYDAAAITSIYTTVRKNQCCGNNSLSDNYTTSQGVSAVSPFIDSNISAQDHTGGLSLVYSIACDPYSWMCSYGEVLALPIAYKIGAEMCRHGLSVASGDRSSNNMNLNTDQMAADLSYFEASFNQQMDTILSSMHLPKDNLCFQCNTPSRIAVILP